MAFLDEAIMPLYTNQKKPLEMELEPEHANGGSMEELKEYED